MKGFTLIAAVHQGTNLIGHRSLDGQLLWTSPIELSWFREVTMGQVVLMGRHTYESINHGLKERVVIVLTRSPDKYLESPKNSYMRKYVGHRTAEKGHVYVTDDIEYVIREVCSSSQRLFIAGGAQIYSWCLSLPFRNYCEACYISRVSCAVSQDIDLQRGVFMPALPQDMSVVYVSRSVSDQDASQVNGEKCESFVFDVTCLSYPENAKNARGSLKGDFKQWSAKKLFCQQANANWECVYKEIIREITDTGSRQIDRTEIGTASLFGKQLRFDTRGGLLPLMSLKKTPLKSIFLELQWFLNGRTSAKWLSERGVCIWNANSSEETLRRLGLPYEPNDCGPIYGFQLRHFGADYKGSDKDYTGQGVDQWKALIDGLKQQPFSRRHVVSFWNPQALSQVCLPACHVLYQFNVQKDDERTVLNLQVYQRSADMLLGVPFNMASYAILLILVAHHIGAQSGEVIITLGDCHIYNNHENGLAIIERQPFVSPVLKCLHAPEKEITDVQLEDLKLLHYASHSHISLPMAV